MTLYIITGHFVLKMNKYLICPFNKNLIYQMKEYLFYSYNHTFSVQPVWLIRAKKIHNLSSFVPFKWEVSHNARKRLKCDSYCTQIISGHSTFWRQLENLIMTIINLLKCKTTGSHRFCTVCCSRRAHLLPPRLIEPNPV